MWRILFVSSSAWIDEKVHGPFMERIWLPERTAATLTRMFRYGQSVFDVLGRKPVSRRHCNGTDLNNLWPRSVAAFFSPSLPAPLLFCVLVITCLPLSPVGNEWRSGRYPFFSFPFFFFFVTRFPRRLQLDVFST